MLSAPEVITLLHQSHTGNIPPNGALQEAQELIGFSFGTVFDSNGNIAEPGATNQAIADHIVNDEFLRSIDMVLQHELAVAVEGQDPTLSNSIQRIGGTKKPGVAYNTSEVIAKALPGWTERRVGQIAVVGFRHHLPRAVAQVIKAGKTFGLSVSVPDMRGVGDFDPKSSQRWTRSRGAWNIYDPLAIGYCLLRNEI